MTARAGDYLCFSCIFLLLLIIEDSHQANSLRLRGGYARTLAASYSPKEAPRSAASSKLSGGAFADQEDSIQLLNAPREIASNQEFGEEGGEMDQEEADDSNGVQHRIPLETEVNADLHYDPSTIHSLDPWIRASVNVDGFESATKGRNMKLSPSELLSWFPFPIPFLTRFNHVKLKRDKGNLLNKLFRSPISPRPQAFGGRRTDPLDFLHRRPFLVIPLSPSGSQSQPHPMSKPVKESDCRGGVVQTMRTLRTAAGDCLSYFEARVSGNADGACIGVVSLRPEFEPNVYDHNICPSGDCVVYGSNGALLWDIDTDKSISDQEKILFSAVASPERSFRSGDHVGVLIDLAVGKLAFFRNGKCVAVRSHLAAGLALRFFVGCYHAGCSWSMLPARRARRTLQGFDWTLFYKAPDPAPAPTAADSTPAHPAGTAADADGTAADPADSTTQADSVEMVPTPEAAAVAV